MGLDKDGVQLSNQFVATWGESTSWITVLLCLDFYDLNSQKVILNHSPKHNKYLNMRGEMAIGS